jgi:hypothetical protein
MMTGTVVETTVIDIILVRIWSVFMRRNASPIVALRASLVVPPSATSPTWPGVG